MVASKGEGGLDAVFRQLTIKQHEVMRYVADQFTSKQIAWELGISESAVNQRIEAVRARAGAQPRAELGRAYRTYRRDQEAMAELAQARGLAANSSAVVRITPVTATAVRTAMRRSEHRASRPMLDTGAVATFCSRTAAPAPKQSVRRKGDLRFGLGARACFRIASGLMAVAALGLTAAKASGTFG